MKSITKDLEGISRRGQSNGCEASQVEARAIDVSAMLEEMASRLAKDLCDASHQAKTLEHRLVSKTDERLCRDSDMGKLGKPNSSREITGAVIHAVWRGSKKRCMTR